MFSDFIFPDGTKPEDMQVCDPAELKPFCKDYVENVEFMFILATSACVLIILSLVCTFSLGTCVSFRHSLTWNVFCLGTLFNVFIGQLRAYQRSREITRVTRITILARRRVDFLQR